MSTRVAIFGDCTWQVIPAGCSKNKSEVPIWWFLMRSEPRG